jgi:hypothetical protein
LQPCLVKLPHLPTGIILLLLLLLLLLHRSLFDCTFLVLLSLCCLISPSAAAALYYKLNTLFAFVLYILDSRTHSCLSRQHSTQSVKHLPCTFGNNLDSTHPNRDRSGS